MRSRSTSAICAKRGSGGSIVLTATTLRKRHAMSYIPLTRVHPGCRMSYIQHRVLRDLAVAPRLSESPRGGCPPFVRMPANDLVVVQEVRQRRGSGSRDRERREKESIMERVL